MRRHSAAGAGLDELARLLAELRGDRTQTEAASLVGVSQIKISRAERGRYPLSPAEADAYARALDAPEAIRQRVVELAEAKASSHIASRAVLSRSAAAIQARIEQLERRATDVRSWQPEVVIGPLQTENYTAAVLGHDPGPDWFAARAARRTVFTEAGRSWRQIMSEGALRWQLGDASVMVEQLEHLIDVSRRSNVRLGIVKQMTAMPIAAPAAFHIIGDTAMVATEVGTSFVTDSRDLERFNDLFNTLSEVALHGEPARELLRTIRDHYRKLL